MLPVLAPGDGVLALRGGAPRPGQVRVFPDPGRPTRWLIKRVGQVYGAGSAATFEACSDNTSAPGVVDSRRFGPVPAVGTYRVLWTALARRP
ncbi:MAG: repressor [Mycobacterium sp.]|nr:repressor [Mycobacterium sp.]